MKRVSITVLMTGLFASAALASSPELATVKIRSGRCGSPSSDLSGSGVLFKDAGKIYALTSEHVVLHGKGGDGQICHSVRNAAIGEAKATLKAADWENGLALLEVDASAALDVPALADFASNAPAANDKLILSGFPFSSEKLFTDHEATGRVMSADSDRHLFAGTPPVLEVKGEAEYGMSGGPAFSVDGTKVLGILSHQYLKKQYGPTQVAPIDGPTDENLIFVIASPRLWLERALKADFRPKFARDATIESPAGTDTIYSSGLAFSLSCKVESAPTPSTDGKIGGGNGAGIGGTDHVGIGGSSSACARVGNIRVTQDANHVTDAFDTKVPGWLKLIRNRLYSGDRIEIVSILKSEQEIQFDSLAGFFHVMKACGPACKPRILGDLTPGNKSVADTLSAPLASAFNELRLAAEAMDSALKPEQKVELAFTRQARAIIDATNEYVRLGAWNQINAQDIAALEKRMEMPVANGLYEADFDKTVRFFKAIRSARKALQAFIGDLAQKSPGNVVFPVTPSRYN